MHWIWLWATFKKNNQTTINAPTNTPFVQKYANYNSTGNRTTTSSHLNSGLKKWTKTMKWIQESLTKLLAEYIPKKSVHRFADFYFGSHCVLLQALNVIKDVTARTQGPLLLSLAFSPSLATMPHYSIWLTLCLNFCWSSKQEYFLRPRFSRGGLWKISEGTRSCRSGKYYEQQYFSLVYSSLVLWME